MSLTILDQDYTEGSNEIIKAQPHQAAAGETEALRLMFLSQFKK